MDMQRHVYDWGFFWYQKENRLRKETDLCHKLFKFLKGHLCH